MNAGIPAPTPTPTTPASTPAPTPTSKAQGIVDGLSQLHKNVFGFQALDATVDTNAVLPVTAEIGVMGTAVNDAAVRERPSPLLSFSRPFQHMHALECRTVTRCGSCDGVPVMTCPQSVFFSA